MEKIKCMTFDEEGQDNLSQEIKAKMKAAQVESDMLKAAKVEAKKTPKIYRERLVDKWLKRCVDEAGGMTMKMHPITNAGVPDRIIHFRRMTFYVEVKTTGEAPTPLQIEMHKRLHKMGIQTYVLDVKITDLWELFNVCYTTYESKHYKRNPHINV